MPEWRLSFELWSPGPQKVSDPYSEDENSKLSYKTQYILIQKLLAKNSELWYSQYSTTKITKNAHEKKMTVIVIFFSANIFKSIGYRAFRLI